MKKAAFWLLLGSFVTTFVFAEERTYTVDEFRVLHPTYGTYLIEGYAVKKMSCPPCSEGLLCKPCAGDLVQVSGKNKKAEIQDLNQEDILVFLKPEQLIELDEQEKYQFLIQVLDVKTLDQKLPNLKLIYAE